MIESTPRKWRSDGSPVSGDAHAGFCGGPGGETPPGYPTDGMVTRTRYATGETLPAPRRNPRKLGRSYNRAILGKWTDGGRESGGLIRAMNGGNAPGAKEPCCSHARVQREARTT